MGRRGRRCSMGDAFVGEVGARIRREKSWRHFVCDDIEKAASAMI